MNKKFLLGAILVSLGFFTPNLFASDNIDVKKYQGIKADLGRDGFNWDSTYVKADRISEENITVEFGVYYSGDTADTYEIHMQLGDLSNVCKGEMMYESFYMKYICDFDVAQDRIERLYPLRYVVFDESGNVLSSELEVLILKDYESSIDLGEIQLVGFDATDKGREVLISGIFEHDNIEVYDGYKLTLYSGKDSHQKKASRLGTSLLEYNLDTKRLEFEVLAQKYYSYNEERLYSYEIKDKDNDTIYSGIFDYEITTEEDVFTNWEYFKGEGVYKKEDDKTYVKVYLNNVENPISKNYFMDIDLNIGSPQSGLPIQYNTEKNQLYTEFFIDGKESKYKVSYKIRGEDYQILSKGNFVVKIQTSTTPKEEKGKEPKTLSKLEIAINNFVEKQREKYPDDHELAERLEKTQLVLTSYAEKNKKYTSLVEDINNILQKKIDELK